MTSQVCESPRTKSTVTPRSDYNRNGYSRRYANDTLPDQFRKEIQSIPGNNSGRAKSRSHYFSILSSKPFLPKAFERHIHTDRYARQQWISSFRSMFREMALRSDRRGKTMDLDTFLKYFPLPGLLGQRLFSLFDLDKSGTVDFFEFASGLFIIYNGTPEERKKFVFDLYDLDENGYITKDEVISLLVHVPAAFRLLQKLHIELTTLEDDFPGSTPFSPTIAPMRSSTMSATETPRLQDAKLSLQYDSNNEISPFFVQDLSEIVNNGDMSPRITQPKDVYQELDPAIEYVISRIFDSTNVNENNAPICEVAHPDKGLTFEEFNSAVDKIAELSEVLNLFFDLGMPDIPVPPEVLKPDFLHSSGHQSNSGCGILHCLNDRVQSWDDRCDNLVMQESVNDFSRMVKNAWRRVFLLEKNQVFNKLAKAKSFEEVIGTNKLSCSLYHSGSEDLSQLSSKHESTRDCLISGWLFKLGRRFNLRHYRFYILRDRFLYYFTNLNHPVPKKLIFLQGSSIYPVNHAQKKNGHPFEIALTNKKVIRLYAPSKENRNLWVENLLRASLAARFHQNYLLKEVIGEGGFSTVYLGQCRQTYQDVAVKIISRDTFQFHPGIQELFRNEVTALSILKHPHVVQLYNVFESEEFFYLVTEWVPGGDVYTILKEISRHETHYCTCAYWTKIIKAPQANGALKITAQHISEQLAKLIIHCTLKGLSCLHHHRIIHRDIKTENILVALDEKRKYKYDTNCPCYHCAICNTVKCISQVKITDLGLSSVLAPHCNAKGALGTLHYAAPELLSRQSYTCSVDMWALGIMTYHIISTGKFLPFDSQNETKLAQNIIEGEFAWHPAETWEKISSTAKTFIRMLIQTNPLARPTAETALKHPWFYERICTAQE